MPQPTIVVKSVHFNESLNIIYPISPRRTESILLKRTKKIKRNNQNLKKIVSLLSNRQK